MIRALVYLFAPEKYGGNCFLFCPYIPGRHIRDRTHAGHPQETRISGEERAVGPVVMALRP